MATEAEAVKKKPQELAQQRPLQDELGKRIHELSQKKIAFGWKGEREKVHEIERELNELLRQRALVMGSTPKPVAQQPAQMQKPAQAQQPVHAPQPVQAQAASKPIEIPKEVHPQASETLHAGMVKGEARVHYDQAATSHAKNLFLEQVPHAPKKISVSYA